MIPDSEISIENPQKTGTAADRRTSTWDIRNAPRNYLSLVAYQAASALFSFGAVWIITRHLGSEGYGGIIAIIAASQVAQVLVNWTSVAVVRFGVDEFIETEKIARTFWLRFLILAINLALVAAGSSLWFPPLASWLKLGPETFWLVMSHFTVSVVWIHVQMGLQAAKLMRTQGLLQMIERLLILAGLFAVTAAANLGTSWAMICYIACPAAVTVFGLYRQSTYIFTRFSVDWPFIKKILLYSAPLAPMAVVGYFSGSYLDAIFVSRFLSTSDLGIYSVATQISGIAMQLPTLANALLIPLLISLEKEAQTHRTARFFNDVLPTLVLFWGFFCAIGGLCSIFLIPAVFGSEFTESVLPFWVLLAASGAGLPVLIGYSALSHALSATYISMAAAVSSAIANVAFNFLLIPHHGMIGCAWATLLANLVSTLTFGLLLRKSRPISLLWLIFAIIPTFAGAISVFLTKDVVVSFLVCAGFTFLVAYWKRSKLNETVRFVKNFTG